MSRPDLLTSGIYSVGEISRLVDAPLAQVRAWVGTPRGRQAPIIENELGRVSGRNAVSFTNLMELRFVALFTRAGVPLRNVRAIMDEVRRTLHHPHPFATNVVFRTDGRKVVAEIAKKVGVPSIYDLRTKNYEMFEVMYFTLRNGVIFDPNGEATAWRPRQKIAPHVIIRPSYSFGRPVLEDSLIPTRTLAKAVDVEGNVAIVADLFDISERRVREAVAFQASLQTAA